MRSLLLTVALLVALPAAAADVRVVRTVHGAYTAWALVGARIVLVDTGPPGRVEGLWKALRKADLDPKDVSALVLTHGHADHSGKALAVREALGVPIIAGAGDAPVLAAGRDNPLQPTGILGRMIKPIVPKKMDPFEADVLVEDRLDLAPYGVAAKIVVVHGHTPGSLVVVLADGRVASGDLVRGEIVAQHRPHLHFFHDDEPTANAAIDTLLAEGVTAFLPGHGDVLQAADVAAWRERTRGR